MPYKVLNIRKLRKRFQKMAAAQVADTPRHYGELEGAIGETTHGLSDLVASQALLVKVAEYNRVLAANILYQLKQNKPFVALPNEAQLKVQLRAAGRQH
jgi:hypothetical protein